MRLAFCSKLVQYYYHGRHPFTCVHGSVEEDGRLGALTTTAPEVNARDDAVLERVANGDDTGVAREASLQVS